MSMVDLPAWAVCPWLTNMPMPEGQEESFLRIKEMIETYCIMPDGSFVLFLSRPAWNSSDHLRMVFSTGSAITFRNSTITSSDRWKD
jgi:hypothetical protein